VTRERRRKKRKKEKYAPLTSISKNMPIKSYIRPWSAHVVPVCVRRVQRTDRRCSDATPRRRQCREPRRRRIPAMANNISFDFSVKSRCIPVNRIRGWRVASSRNLDGRVLGILTERTAPPPVSQPWMDAGWSCTSSSSSPSLTASVFLHGI
jgi:hypothetical protein